MTWLFGSNINTTERPLSGDRGSHILLEARIRIHTQIHNVHWGRGRQSFGGGLSRNSRDSIHIGGMEGGGGGDI